MRPKLKKALWITLPLWVVLLINPIHSLLLHVALICATAGVYACLLIQFWKHKAVKVILFVLPVLALIPFVLPSHPIDCTALRTAYLNNLKSYVGTRYVWGGENRIGIDCSGLPRKSLRMALLSCGLRTGNGGAIRSYAEQWWFDASAKALSQSYRGYTIPLHVSGKIQTLDYSTFEPGDLAVTANGVHVMVYWGGDLWIQAEPGIGKVAILNGRTDANHWFKVPVTIHRWTVLAG